MLSSVYHLIASGPKCILIINTMALFHINNFAKIAIIIVATKEDVVSGGWRRFSSISPFNIYVRSCYEMWSLPALDVFD